MKLFDEFPPVSTAEWEDLIRRDLKGADYEKKLLWKTEEGIDVRPYYREEDLAGLDYLTGAAPARFPFVRGSSPDRNGWRIREEIAAASAAEANRLARESLENGADEVAFSFTPADARDVRSLLEGIAGETVRVHFRAGNATPRLLDVLLASQLPLRGTADFDPLGGLACTGTSPWDAETLFTQVETGVRRCAAGLPLFRPLAVRAGLVAEAGGTVVQELGYGLAHAAEYLAELTSRGLPIDQAAPALTLHFAVGANYFFEIAKLRAARLLYARMVEAFGPTADETCRASLAVFTARWDKTIYDPYVNVLRATTEAMSAVLGGCESLCVTPFNEVYQPPDEFSRRLARNTQIILRQEAYLDRHADPAAGSYFLEHLTDTVAREAWKLFQQVEAQGGYLAALQSGAIQQEVRKTAAARRAAVASRRRVFLGANRYPNPDERVLPQLRTMPVSASPPDAAALRVDPLPPERGAAPFEQLRLRTERHAAAGGKTPCFFLLESGDVKMRQARSGFAANFLTCAGFRAVESGPVGSVDAALAAAHQSGADAVVLCSADAEYPTLAAEVCAKTKLPVLVAGYPQETAGALRASGIVDFIHLRSDPLQVLAAWQDRLGVRA